MHKSISYKYQKGSSLLEGLISIAIFSFGVLGTMTFQANMLAQSTQTSYRLISSMLVNSLAGAAEADPKNFACYTTVDNDLKGAMDCTSANIYMESWKEQVAKIKGVSTESSSSVLNADGDLVISVYWKTSKESKIENSKGEVNLTNHVVTTTLHPLILGG